MIKAIRFFLAAFYSLLTPQFALQTGGTRTRMNSIEESGEQIFFSVQTLGVGSRQDYGWHHDETRKQRRW